MSYLSELRIKLKTNAEERIDFHQSSLFQGVLMESISKDYAGCIHQSGLHPYSQFIQNRGELVWIIRTINDEAYKGIIEPMISPQLKTIELRQKQIQLEIVERSVSSVSYEDLLKTFYSDKTDRFIKVAFDSPTAFKRNSEYVFWPDVRLVFGSLMRKYSASSSEAEMTDEETLDYIAKHTSISDYKIRSTRFPLESTKIPSFMGEVTFHFKGTETMSRYAKMLLEFGKFSGVGIKCGIGMGAISIVGEDK